MKKINNILIIIFLILGIIFGIYFPKVIETFSFIGDIYINLLKFMIIPTISTGIITTIYKSTKNKNNLLPKTILTFIIMFISTFILTSIIVKIINPANNFQYEIINWNDNTTKLNFTQIINSLFPSNIISIFEKNSIFSAIILATAIGFCTSKVQNGNKLIEIIEILKNICNKLLEYIMYLTPLATFSLIGNVIINYKLQIIKVGIKYIATSYFCSIISLFIIMIIPVWLIAKINPLKYIKKVSKIWLITVTTCSSLATLPYTLKICNEEFKIPEKYTNIIIPLGCTIHMCGGAVSFALLGLFCSSLFSIPIDPTTYIIMLFSATLINMAAPGIPSSGIVIGATYLQLLNIPLTFIGFYSGIYKILDMIYTTLNVTGDISANIIISHIEENKKKIA